MRRVLLLFGKNVQIVVVLVEDTAKACQISQQLRRDTQNRFPAIFASPDARKGALEELLNPTFSLRHLKISANPRRPIFLLTAENLKKK